MRDSIDTHGSTYGVSVSSDGKFAFLADGSNGLVIASLTQELKDKNEFISTIEMNTEFRINLSILEFFGSARGSALSQDENIIFITHKDLGFIAVDVYDKKNPKRIGQI